MQLIYKKSEVTVCLDSQIATLISNREKMEKLNPDFKHELIILQDREYFLSEVLEHLLYDKDGCVRLSLEEAKQLRLI